MKGKRILLVEDSPDIRSFVGTLARMEGAELVVVGSGEEGITLLEADRQFDVIILDINLPKMSGWDFLRELRERLAEDDRSPVLIFTASADPETRSRAAAEGAKDLVVKPVAVRELRQRIRHVIRGGSRL